MKPFPNKQDDCGGEQASLFAASGIARAWINGKDGMVWPGPGAADILDLFRPTPISELRRRLSIPVRPGLARLMRSARRNGAAACKLLVRRNKCSFQIRVSVQRRQLDDGTPVYDLIVVDLTEEQSEIDGLRRSEENLRYIVEYNPQLPWIADAQGNIIDFTDRWLESSGLDATEATGNGWLAATHPDDIEEVGRRISESLVSGEPFDVRVRLMVSDEYRWMRAQAYPRRNDAGEIVRWYGYTEDIHESVLVEEQIRWNAEHDSLTELPNRALFSNSLERALGRALQSLERVGILLLDIDNFKDVNDLMGHHAGDQLLRHFANRLTAAFGTSALVARLGGDEFAILLNNVGSREELAERAQVALAIRESLASTGRSLECRASIGASIFPDDGHTATELMMHADLALYQAKSLGRGQLQQFDKSLLRDVQDRVAMVNRARTAVREGTILTYYQPKVALNTGEIVGFEALLRWRDAQGAIRSPAEIYAAFEDHDVADMIGQTMTQQVFADMAEWTRLGLSFQNVAINVSSAELRRDNFVMRLIENMNDFAIEPSSIEVEITEGVFLGAGSDLTRDTIAALHREGIPLALDDFGTGFASLSHLRSLPVSTLKIDRSFVAGVVSGGGDRAIVAALVSLGAALNMKVVAEGIEHEDQAAALRQLGCPYAQGFLFGRPTASELIPALIRSSQDRHELVPAERGSGDILKSRVR